MMQKKKNVFRATQTWDEKKIIEEWSDTLTTGPREIRVSDHSNYKTMSYVHLERSCYRHSPANLAVENMP